MDNTNDILKELLHMVDKGSLWTASCDMERLGSQSMREDVKKALWGFEVAIDNLREDIRDTIIDFEE